MDRILWKLGIFFFGLLIFYGLIELLDYIWYVLGLGYIIVDFKLIVKGVVLYYNGNLKSWLKIGIEKYKSLWDKYIDYNYFIL